MYKQNQVLVELLGPLIRAMGYEMLGIEQLAQGRHSVIRIYIDRASGITLTDCEQVSEQVTGLLDVEDPVKGSYNLEVSSPGLDRPLFTLEHFRRYLGAEARVQLRSKLDGRRKLSGRIEAVEGETVVMNMDGIVYRVPAEMIEKARLVPEL